MVCIACLCLCCVPFATLADFRLYDNKQIMERIAFDLKGNIKAGSGFALGNSTFLAVDDMDDVKTYTLLGNKGEIVFTKAFPRQDMNFMGECFDGKAYYILCASEKESAVFSLSEQGKLSKLFTLPYPCQDLIKTEQGFVVYTEVNYEGTLRGLSPKGALLWNRPFDMDSLITENFGSSRFGTRLYAGSCLVEKGIFSLSVFDLEEKKLTHTFQGKLPKIQNETVHFETINLCASPTGVLAYGWIDFPKHHVNARYTAEFDENLNLIQFTPYFEYTEMAYAFWHKDRFFTLAKTTEAFASQYDIIDAKLGKHAMIFGHVDPDFKFTQNAQGTHFGLILSDCFEDEEEQHCQTLIRLKLDSLIK